MTRPSAIQFFSKKAATFFQTDGDNAVRTGLRYRETLEKLKINVPVGKLLDVGIASGSLSLPFHAKGFDVHGIDGAKKMLRLAEKKGIPADNLQQVDLLRKELPFDDDTFDITLTSSTLFYLSNACQVIREMIAVTKPGGVILIDPELHNADTNQTFSYSIDDDKPHFYIQSEQALKQVFKEMGVDVLYYAHYGRREQTSDKHEAFQVTNTLFVLRKNQP